MRLDSGGRQGPDQTGQPFAARRMGLASNDPGEAAAMRHDARRLDDGRDLGHPADQTLGPENRREQVERIDTVLQDKKHGLRVE